MRARWLSVPFALHAALFGWAALAWIGGPFQGAGVVDGAEILELARTGSAGPFETKSPLYPWLLGRCLALGGAAAWTVVLLGMATSMLLQGVIAALAWRLAGVRAAFAAALFYCASGSVLAFGVQPLETLFATLLLAAGALATERGGRLSRAAGGLLLGAAPFARINLLLPALVLWARAPTRRSAALWTAPMMVALLLLAFGERSLPEGGALNLRLGNDPARGGFTELRAGPRYDRLRLEAVFEQPADAPLEPAARWHLRLLGRAVADDPLGFAGTLARKAYLFLHRTEIVASADFRHGLRELPLAPLLLASFGLIAPLAIVGLLRRPPPVLLWPLLALLLDNVLGVTAARYRFGALPFLCVAAALAVTRRPTRRELALLALLALALWPNLSGARLVTPGDGLVQEGYLRLAAAPGSEEARAVLERAVRAGDDPRARYLLGLASEQAGLGTTLEPQHREALLAAADRWYAAALELEPAYPEAAENRVALALRRGRTAQARELARELLAVPYAGLVHLNLAETLPASDPERADLARRGHERMALRAHAQGSPDALRHARAALELGSRDARVAGLARAPARGPARGAAGERR